MPPASAAGAGRFRFCRSDRLTPFGAARRAQGEVRAVHREDGEDVADAVDDDEAGGLTLRLRLGDALGDDLLDVGDGQALGRRRLEHRGRRRDRGILTSGCGPGPLPPLPPPPQEPTSKAAMAIIDVLLRFTAASGSPRPRGRGSPGNLPDYTHWDRAPRDRPR